MGLWVLTGLFPALTTRSRQGWCLQEQGLPPEGSRGLQSRSNILGFTNGLWGGQQRLGFPLTQGGAWAVLRAFRAVFRAGLICDQGLWRAGNPCGLWNTSRHLAGRDECAETLPTAGSASFTILGAQNGITWAGAFPIVKARSSGAKG